MLRRYTVNDGRRATQTPPVAIVSRSLMLIFLTAKKPVPNRSHRFVKC